MAENESHPEKDPQGPNIQTDAELGKWYIHSVTEVPDQKVGEMTATMHDALNATTESKKELSPEQVESWLGEFKLRFEAIPKLHVGIEWSSVEKSLRADPSAMFSFFQLDEKGHQTNVFGEDETSFEIGTCSYDAPRGHRYIVFDKAAQTNLNPKQKNNGNAVDLAAAIDVDLMDERQYNELKRMINIDGNTWNWLKGGRLRGAEDMMEDFNNPKDQHAITSFRAVRRVKKVA